MESRDAFLGVTNILVRLSYNQESLHEQVLEVCVAEILCHACTDIGIPGSKFIFDVLSLALQVLTTQDRVGFT